MLDERADRDPGCLLGLAPVTDHRQRVGRGRRFDDRADVVTAQQLEGMVGEIGVDRRAGCVLHDLETPLPVQRGSASLGHQEIGQRDDPCTVWDVGTEQCARDAGAVEALVAMPDTGRCDSQLTDLLEDLCAFGGRLGWRQAQDDAAEVGQQTTQERRTARAGVEPAGQEVGQHHPTCRRDGRCRSNARDGREQRGGSRRSARCRFARLVHPCPTREFRLLAGGR